MQFFTYFILFAVIFHVQSTAAQDIEWREVGGLGFSHRDYPFVEMTEQGKKYLYHLDSGTKADKIEDHAADLMVVAKEGQYGVFRTDGRLILPFAYDEINLETGYQGQWYDGMPYDYKYIIIKKDGRYGYADDNGTILAPPQYQNINVLSRTVVAMQQEHRWGWMNGETGEVRQACRYDHVRNMFSDNHIEVSEKNKIGLAKSDGQIVIPIEYNNLFNIFTEDLKYIEAAKDKSVFLYDSLGQVKIPSGFDDIRTVGHSKLVQYRQGDRYGLVDPMSGKIITEAKYSNIRTGLRGRYIVEQNKQYGIVDDNGKEIIPVAYTSIEFIDAANSRKDGTLFGPKVPSKNPPTKEQLLRQRRDSMINALPYYIRVHKDKTYGIFDWEGKQIIPTGTYIDIQPHYHKDIFYKVYNDQRLFGILDVTGKEILPPNHYAYSSYNYSKDAITSNLDLANRYIPFQENQDQYAFPAPIGLFDLEAASIIIPPSPQSIKWLDENHFVVIKRDDHKSTAVLYTKDGGLIHHLGEGISEVDTLGEQRLLIQKDNQYYMVDFKGNRLYSNPEWTTRGHYMPVQFPKIDDHPSGFFYTGLKKIYADVSNLFVDTQGQERLFSAYDYVDDFYLGTAVVAKRVPDENSDLGFTYHYGLIDTSGNELIPAKWHNISTINNCTNLLGVAKDDKWGSINRIDGNYIIPPIYDLIVSSSSHPTIHILLLNDKYGLATLDGDVVVEPIYDDLYRVPNGDGKTWMLLVQKGDWYYFVDEEGKPYPIRSKQRTY